MNLSTKGAMSEMYPGNTKELQRLNNMMLFVKYPQLDPRAVIPSIVDKPENAWHHGRHGPARRQQE